MVILGLTPGDLQLSLNTLSEYCIKWDLEVNVAKTKIVVFSKRGNEHRVYNNELLETVDHFKLPICITFNYTGNFKINIETIYHKGKAMNSLVSNINKYSTNPKISLQLFDAFVSSTLSYGC